MNVYNAIDVYGKAGLAFLHMDVARATIGSTNLHAKTTRTAFVGLAGAGFQYHVCDHMTTSLGYSRYLRHGDLHNVDLFDLGVTYRF